MLFSRLRLLNMSKLPIHLLNAKKQSSSSVKGILEARNAIGKTFSVELLPTATLDFEQLSTIDPTFYSVIWRQSETTPVNNPEQTAAILLCKQLIDRGYHVLLHLAGRYLKENQALGILNEAKRIGIKDIFALKGEYVEYFEKTGEKYDFQSSVELIRFIKSNFGDYFSICVAGCPDCHPHFATEEEDTKFLAEKVNAGADFIITQALFTTASYKSFCIRCRNAGIQIPVLPGLWLFDTYETLNSCANLCKLKVQEEILETAARYKSDAVAMKEYGTETITKLVEEFLKDEDTPGVHFFSLNNISLVKDILERLKVCDVKL